MLHALVLVNLLSQSVDPYLFLELELLLVSQELFEGSSMVLLTADRMSLGLEGALFGLAVLFCLRTNTIF